jgi:hypothetical protein
MEHLQTLVRNITTLANLFGVSYMQLFSADMYGIFVIDLNKGTLALDAT